METKKLKHQLMLMCICFFIVLSCDEDNKTEPDCGCDSETLSIISESDNLIGQIWYKTKQNSNDDDYYNNKYWISIVVKDSDKADHFIICNEELLNDYIINLAKSTSDTEVKFAGELKEICEKRFDVIERTYSRIVLTKIELK